MDLKKQMISLFACMALIIYISGYMIRTNRTQEQISMVSKQLMSHLEVYMKGVDGMLIPLCIEVSEDESQEQQIQKMLGYLDGRQQLKGFVPLFQTQCELKNITIEQGVAKLYFNDSFKNYAQEDELKLLESLTWGLTQFKNVNRVELYVNEERLTMMPNAHTPMNDTLDRSIGINQFECSSNHLSQTTQLIMYVTKKVEDREYVLPRSKRVELVSMDYDTLVKELVKDVSISSGCHAILSKEGIGVNYVQYGKGTLKVDLNRQLFGSNQEIKKLAYDCMYLSLCELQSVEAVELSVDGKKLELKAQQEYPLLKHNVIYNEARYE